MSSLNWRGVTAWSKMQDYLQYAALHVRKKEIKGNTRVCAHLCRRNKGWTRNQRDWSCRGWVGKWEKKRKWEWGSRGEEGWHSGQTFVKNSSSRTTVMLHIPFKLSPDTDAHAPKMWENPKWHTNTNNWAYRITNEKHKHTEGGGEGKN